MHAAVQALLDALRPRAVAAGVYEAGHATEMGQHLFGGQVLAQALGAAQAESDGTPVHALHANFLHRGNTRDPIRLEVTGLRHSRAFRTFQVVASQQEEPILTMSVSHHRDETGPIHQIPMDEVGEPEGETYERGLLRAMTPTGEPAEEPAFELPVEIRGVGGLALFTSEVKPPQARCWMRMRDALPDDPPLHQCLFAYASDYAIMAPAVHPHPFPVTALQSASLDHAVWFHRPFRMDEWLLFEVDSPVATGARAIGRGLLYTRDGLLVASCVQEALLRPRR
ncbi:MAG: thioesterase family protein [Myxococcota bacterium]|nr:thioesterase family protein [Myxococcota bacterium]